MKRIFETAKIPFVRFEAVDRERAAAHPLRSKIPTKRLRDWTLGELGCLLSHIEVWKLIASSDDPFGAVFEDDVHIDPNLRAFLEGPIPKEIDVVKLETVNLHTRVSRWPRASVASVGLHELKSLHTGAGAYALSRRAARALVERVTMFDVPADHLLFELDHPSSRNLLRVQCVPALAIQDCVLPSDRQKGGFLSSAMSDRPVWAPTAKKLRLVDRVFSSPFSVPRRLLLRGWASATTRAGTIGYLGPLQE